MSALFIGFVTLLTFAQSTIGIQDHPCDFVPGSNNLALDFAGLCKYEKANLELRAAGANRVVYLGDSITELWRNGIVGLDGHDTLNRGYSGQTTTQLLARFRADVIKLRPRILHLMAGTNDIAGNTGPTTIERIKDNIRTMSELAQMHGIRVIIGSVLPARSFSWRPGMKPAATIIALNSWLKTYALNSGFVYADYHGALTEADGGLPIQYAQDGVHPTPAGYAVMQRIARDAILEAQRQ